jgi:energy-coupling factor transport system permease protein
MACVFSWFATTVVAHPTAFTELRRHTMAQPVPSVRWRTVDIVVAAVIAVAFGVVFWAWGLLYNGPADAIALPGRAVLYGVWLVPGVLGGLIIRKPGAALFTEVLATIVSIAIGAVWGWPLINEGILEALGAELGFALFLYRRYGLLVASIAGALSGAVAGVYDIVVYYPASDFSTAAMRVPYVAIVAASSLVVAGIGSWALAKALAQTGVLDRFPSGRERAAV